MDAMLSVFIKLIAAGVEFFFFFLFRCIFPLIGISIRIVFTLIFGYPKVFFICVGFVGAVVLTTTGINSITGRSWQPQPQPSQVVFEETTTPVMATIMGEKPAERSTPTLTQTKRVTRDVNLRSGAGIDHSIVKVLSKNMVVTLLGPAQEVDGSVWVEVEVGSTIGWVNQKFLE